MLAHLYPFDFLRLSVMSFLASLLTDSLSTAPALCGSATVFGMAAPLVVMSEAVSLYGHIHFLIIFPNFPGPHSDSKSLPRGPPTLPRTPPSSRATIPRTESFRLTHAMHTPMPLGHPDPHRSLPLHD